MRRLLFATAAVSMFLFSRSAGAQDMPAALAVKAKLKVDGSSGSEQTFVYVTGETIYPDGTKICVGVQAPGRADYIRPVAWSFADHGKFLAEIGPWDKHFPAGRYHVVAEFRFEDQNPAMQQILGTSRDMEHCVDDPVYREKYLKENPERLKLLEEYLKRTHRCPGKTAMADTWVQVGTDDEADRARITEDKDLREHAEEAGRLARSLATPTQDAAALAEWRDDHSQLEAAVRRNCASVISTLRPEAWQNLQTAYTNLGWCADDSESLSTGEGSRLSTEIRDLETEAPDKDVRRRLARDHADLDALLKKRLEHATAAAEALAAALYGPRGLEPAPERARTFAHELVSAFGDKH